MDCTLRNAIQHESFFHDLTEEKYFYTDPDGVDYTLTHFEMTKKVIFLLDFYIQLQRLIDISNLIKTVSGVLKLILTRSALKYSSKTHEIFLQGEKIATRIALSELVYCYGLQMVEISLKLLRLRQGDKKG